MWDIGVSHTSFLGCWTEQLQPAKSGHSMEPASHLGPATLLPLNLDAASAWQPALRAALYQAPPGSRLYLALQGELLLFA